MKGFPRRFGPYALAKPLARGGMGALYLAVRGTDARSRVCVIKTVLPHLADKEYLQRFRDEGKVVVQLSHENLVPVFDSGEAEGEIYLGMNFIDGKDLRAVWNRCAKKGVAFPMDVAVFIVRELARGLTYAHNFGDIKLVHRDVSPPNVLVSYDGSVKLTDFGLASSTLKMEKTAPGIIYGKVSYMSPEQARGEPMDGRTDQFAAGIILWELLTGRQLYPARPALPATAPAPPVDAAAGGAASPAAPTPAAAEDLLRMVRNPQILAPSRRASRVPAELDRIVLRALAPRLADRYPSCADFAADLSAYLASNAPQTDSARVAKFLGELYAEDLASERADREAVILEARALLRRPPGKDAKEDTKDTKDREAQETALAVVGVTPTGKDLAGHLPPPPPSSAVRAPPPPRRSGRETVVAGLVDRARDRRQDEVSAAFSDNLLSSPNLDTASNSVLGTLVGGRYRVRRLRGEGGMGRVYEAEHIEIGKRVALKILHPGYSQTPDLVERLRREARAASRIGHPNVVDVTDSGTTDGGAFFFVMEYLEGRELGEIVFEEKGLELRRAIAITGQICRALQAAHKAGVIHRDLKPENVLLVERDGQKDFVKVLDFGIAKNLTDQEEETDGAQPRRKLTSPGVAMGTPEYMAPEQAAGRPADVRSDVYAVGGLLYEMLCGRAAYEGSNFMEILHKKATQAPAPISSFRSDVPPEIEDLVRRTMSKDPAARPQTMEELERELNEIAWQCLPSPSFDPNSLRIDTPRSMVLNGVRYTASGLGVAAAWDRLVADRRRLSLVGAAAFAVVALAIFGISRSVANLHHGSGGETTSIVASNNPAGKQEVAPPVPTPAVNPPSLAPVAAHASAASDHEPARTTGAATAEGAAEGPPEASAEPQSEADPRAALAATVPLPLPLPLRARAPATGSPGPSGVESKKMLGEGEQLLRAQRFTEAREVFTKLTKAKSTRGRALVALAEIAFQEKNYEETIRSAKLAADRGGGARARVLLGDAHFRLSHFQDAAAAYGQALRLEPDNQSAKSGLALASKRM